ncbi:hypothetical protein DL96DRAFT_1103586 [Flagelloscypha sp. PMI_526]|nr:hypothetical protein DL96DRAFT_1103586 [Flagelloscypha sp. PMI_526]
MDTLPPELHRLIFSHACTDHGGTVRALNLTCRYYHQIVRPSLYELVWFNWEPTNPDHSLERLKGLLETLTHHLALPESLPVRFVWLAATCPSLDASPEDDIPKPPPDDDVDSTVSRFFSLLHPSLEFLALLEPQSISKTWPTRLPNHLPLLSDLTIIGTCSEGDPPREWVYTRLIAPNVRTLRLGKTLGELLVQHYVYSSTLMPPYRTVYLLVNPAVQERVANFLTFRSRFSPPDEIPVFNWRTVEDVYFHFLPELDASDETIPAPLPSPVLRKARETLRTLLSRRLLKDKPRVYMEDRNEVNWQYVKRDWVRDAYRGNVRYMHSAEET